MSRVRREVGDPCREGEVKSLESIEQIARTGHVEGDVEVHGSQVECIEPLKLVGDARGEARVRVTQADVGHARLGGDLRRDVRGTSGP